MRKPDPPAPEGGPRVVFVYYRIQPARVPRLQRAFAESLSKAGPWRAQLMRRVDEVAAGDGADPGDLQTWMEVYWLAEGPAVDLPAGDGQSIPPAGRQAAHQRIEGLAQAAGIVDLVDGARHYEVFEACA